MFKLANEAEFNAGLGGWFAACALLADEALRATTWAAFDYIANATPQYSGHMAGSWILTVGAPSAAVSPKPEMGHWGMENPLEKGHPTAVNLSEVMARSVLASVHLGVDAYITNPAPYAMAVEKNVHEDTGRPFLREINMPGEMVQQAAGGIPGFGPELSESIILTYAKGSL